MTTDTTDTDDSTEYRIGDPVVDLAQGRPMIVLDTPDQTVSEWSDANNYDLRDNYANSKFSPSPDEPVVTCVYVSDVRSEPSKDYTFPVSRVCLIDAHHADDGRRVYDRVAEDVLTRLFEMAIHFDDNATTTDIRALADHAGINKDVTQVALELAQVESRGDADE